MLRITKLAIALLLIQGSYAQVTDTTGEEMIDYSQFGDASGVKRYATQKVMNQTPNRIISIGYEQQGAFSMPGVKAGPMLPAFQNFLVNKLSGLRAQVNVPVVSNTKIIWQLGANYAGAMYRFSQNPTNDFVRKLNENGLHTAGVNTTVFKPLNEKNFLIVQASADVNAGFSSLDEISSRSVTYSGALVYGWKYSDKNMFGIGVTRSYRAGQPMIFPVVLWNKTFNDQWGMELLLPARGHLRYNFSTSNILQLGYELEGNQYSIRTSNSPSGQLFIQRGELKPRISWDKKLTGFIWFNAQAGWRYNWRFDVMSEYNARKDDQLYFRSKLGNPAYFSISLNFVSP